MLLHSPLTTITPTVDGDVLAALAGAEDWFTTARLHVLIPDRSREGIRRALSRLAEQGVVDVLVAGSTRTYQLNRDHLAAPAITALASMKAALLDRLRWQLEQWIPAPMFAGVFGSAATGVMSTSSDIDLFLLHPGESPSGWDEALDALTTQARRWTGNPGERPRDDHRRSPPQRRDGAHPPGHCERGHPADRNAESISPADGGAAMSPPRSADSTIKAGRWAKARHFAEAAVMRCSRPRMRWTC